MLGVFRNTLTAKHQYPDRDSLNFPSPSQMQLSLKPTIFSNLFVPFLESTSNFKHFVKKNDCHTYFFSEMTECERLG